ncbi:MAG: prepilin-type N-terminal cleavage/methylation domain-containing protein [Candidatus Gracilibacteria bacterium]|nr:prepilin-type N-terminal cleavage/methylation domain-containing protein [Candidatus Gracilibacteria bacterium]
MNKQTNAFTLVELIVVIVILAILGTIAFISFQGYSRNSRDSVRIADINSTKKSLEIFITKSGFYPTPDGATNITYSGTTVWVEGTIGVDVIKNIQSVSKVIIDPLTSNEYTYSITSSKTEYQIGAISEVGGLTNNKIINNIYATDLNKINAVAYISGNYNEKFTKVNTGTISWILAQPSIIATDIGNSDLGNILSNKKVVFNNYGNYPHSYNQNSAGGFNYTNGNPIIFTGTLEELHEDNQRKLDFMTNLKQAYISTDLATNPIYEDIMSLDTSNDSTGTINLAISYINSNKGGIKLEQLPLLGTTAIINGNTGSITTYVVGDCDSSGQLLTGSTTYGSCNANDIIVCSGNGVGYTISSCNIGTNISGTGESSYGIYFQWGRNKGFSIDDITQQTTKISGTIGLNASTDTYGFVWSESLPSPLTWASTDITDNWGSLTNTSEARKGPCEEGYHIPSNLEWIAIISAGGWGMNGTGFINDIKIPMAGRRYYATGVVGYKGSNGNYWSSSHTTNYAYELQYNNISIYPSSASYRVDGKPIRCIKN